MSSQEINNKVAEDAAEAAACALTELSIGSKSDDEGDDEIEIPQRFTKSGRKRAVPFPMKLMKVLSNKKFRDIITWTPSGKAFTIVQPKAFVAEILPEHFKSAKFSSFTRKLHRWGFMRHYRGEESGAFYHKDFQKDRMDLVEQMTCKAEPSKSVAAIAKKPVAPKTTIQGSQPGPLPQPAPLGSDLSQLQAPPQASVVASHLDAAIEAEVTRRLQERISQAALSRMFMQQQLNNPVIPLGLRMQLLEMQQKKLSSSVTSPRIPLSNTQFQNPSDMGLRTNIQGAKTA
eukprot:Nitzschia sp. Nitz4//scaffold35_size145790//135274//136217//NITZ4_003059-RA/size145790-augustus-gene-0.126-mRNA-1//1//CDS//3329549211//7378//frame0